MESAATTLPTAVDEGVRPTLAGGGDWRDRTTNTISRLIEACWRSLFDLFGQPVLHHDTLNLTFYPYQNFVASRAQLAPALPL